MRQLVFAIILLLSLSIQSVSYRDVHGKDVENNTGKIQLLIRMEKNHFYHNEDLEIDFIITNKGDEVVTIFPGMNPLESYQLSIKDENDSSVGIKDDFKAKVRMSRKVVNFAGDEVKEIILHKDESFVKKMNLKEYYDLSPDKKYYIIGYLYPNRFESNGYFIKSKNMVSFLFAKQTRQKLVPGFTEYQAQSGVSPEEVLHLFLGAEKNSYWKNYFKWLEIDEFILAYDKFSGIYLKAEPEEKYLIVEEFKKFLTESRSGRLAYYKILSINQMTPHLAEVKVYVERNTGKFKNRFEYTYTLKNNIADNWKITNVIVKVKR